MNVQENLEQEEPTRTPVKVEDDHADETRERQEVVGKATKGINTSLLQQTILELTDVHEPDPPLPSIERVDEADAIPISGKNID